MNRRFSATGVIIVGYFLGVFAVELVREVRRRRAEVRFAAFRRAFDLPAIVPDPEDVIADA